MQYLAARAAAYEHPHHVMPGVRSLLMLAVSYRTVEPPRPARGKALSAAGLGGQDYHQVLRQRLDALAKFHRCLTPDAAVRGVVDTAPLWNAILPAWPGWVGSARTRS